MLQPEWSACCSLHTSPTHSHVPDPPRGPSVESALNNSHSYSCRPESYSFFKPKATSPITTSSTFSEESNLPSLLNFYCSISTSLLKSLFFFSTPLLLPHSDLVSKFRILSLLSCVYNLYWLPTALGKSKIADVVCHVLLHVVLVWLSSHSPLAAFNHLWT